MATYLATVNIGEFDIHAYRKRGISYWDAIDPDLLAPVATAATGTQFALSGQADNSYKRLMHTIHVPAGGATVGFSITRATETNWDFVFVEAHTVGTDDWTTLAGCATATRPRTPGSRARSGAGRGSTRSWRTTRPTTATAPADPTGSTGAWWAATGRSRRPGIVARDHPWAGSTTSSWRSPTRVTRSSRARRIRRRHRRLDRRRATPPSRPTATCSMDGRSRARRSAARATRTTGSSARSRTRRTPRAWSPAGRSRDSPRSSSSSARTSARIHSPRRAASSTTCRGSASRSRPRPDRSTRGTSSAIPIGSDSVVVHELAHQWYGDNLAVERWQHIWLNEGFATYAEWLWSEREGLGTAQENFDFLYGAIPDDDPFWTVIVGDPGAGVEFDFAVYARGAMTLQQLRLAVGDRRLLQDPQALGSLDRPAAT